jgi:DNA-binding LytR/AlgR family response regulator
VIRLGGDPLKPNLKIPLKISAGRFLILDADDVFYIESAGDGSLIRAARKRPFRSSKRLADWERKLRGQGFVRIHRSYLLNLDRLREVRHRGEDPNDWEVKLEPPVNAVLPVGRQYVESLRKLVGL